MYIIIKLSPYKRALRHFINQKVYYEIQTITPITFDKRHSDKWRTKGFMTKKDFEEEYFGG